MKKLMLNEYEIDVLIDALMVQASRGSLKNKSLQETANILFKALMKLKESY
jgi:hypothetical protein